MSIMPDLRVRFTLRIPEELHRRLVSAAKRAGKFQNAMAQELLELGLESEFEKMIQAAADRELERARES